MGNNVKKSRGKCIYFPIEIEDSEPIYYIMESWAHIHLQSYTVKMKKQCTHGSGGVTAAVKSSMSSLPLAGGVNFGDPSVDG